MIQKDVKDAVKRVNPNKKVNGDTIIEQIHTTTKGWQYYGKCVRDFVNDANKNPRFFNRVDEIMIDEEKYEFQSVLFEWDIIDITEFGPAVEGFAWHTYEYDLNEEIEADTVAEMKKKTKEICEEEGWAFLDGGGPVKELRKAYLEIARENRQQ